MKKVLGFAALIVVLSCNSNTAVKNEKTGNKMENTANKEWIKHTNIYEVNVRQYTKEGTFNAFANELPRLKEMGVETLWFMPITPIAEKNKKGVLGSYYACSDYTAINPEFGTMDDWKALVQKAHSMGFKVIIDWVANHTGWDHRWTKEHPEWYLKDSTTGDFQIASGMDDIIELDFSKPELRRAMIDAMKFWVTESNIDGFRADLAFWVELDFWQEAKREMDAVKPMLWLGELDPLETPEYMQVFDAAYTRTWMHKAREFYHSNLPVSSLDSVLQRYEDAPGVKAWFTTNHDENSWNGTEYEKYGDAAKALAVFSCTWKGMPLLYSGQEMPNMKRLEFFQRDPIEWNGKYELNDFYKTLLNLHSTHPALNTDAPVERVQTSDPNVFAFLRKAGEREVLVLLNLSRNTVRFDITSGNISGKFSNAFSKAQSDFTIEKSFEMKGWEYLVYEK